MKKTALFTALLCLAQSPLHAAVPSLISYQGHVTDATGNIGESAPVNRTITFRIWNSATAIADANRLYAEKMVVTINKGDFSVLLGQGTSTGETMTYSTLDSPLLFNGSDVYLGITVDDGNSGTVDAEITPRQRIVSSAFAMRSRVAESVDSAAITNVMLANNAVDSTQIVGNAVTTAKIAASAVTTTQIADGNVTTAKIMDGTITVADIGTGAVTSDKILDGTIATVDIGTSVVTTAKIATDTILAGNIGANQVGTSEITDATVTGTDIAASTISLSNLVAAVQQSLVPAGTIVAFGGATAPLGWLLCDGASVSRVGNYATLFAAVGTAFGAASTTNFNVPDFRGRFLRGWDSNVGRDPDRATRTTMVAGGGSGDAIGSIQGDQFKSHTHTEIALGGYGGGYIGYGTGTSYSIATVASGANGGNETRPLNAYVNYIIKY